MFQSSKGLPHLLAPKAYYSPTIFEFEQENLLRSAWHCVGTSVDLKDSGDFLTTTIAGEEVQVRNFDGKLKALSNVCAHRHCLMTDAVAGNSPTMRCQYHGWEYGQDGYTRKIPCAKDFAPIDRSELRLPEYRVEKAGQLVFVCLDPNAQGLVDFLGPIFDLVSQRFGVEWKLFYKGQVQYAANWKVAIENSLEAYHVESIHPNTFRAAPGEQRTDHQLNEFHTAFYTDMPFAAHHRIDRLFQTSEAWIVRRLGKTPQARYQQHHVFPNLLFSFTDAISLVHSVHPLSATESRSLMFQFGVFPSAASFWQRWIATGLGSLERRILKGIMQEDIRLYPKIQRGLMASSHRGALARSEERIHAFQAYLAKAMRDRTNRNIDGLNRVEIETR